MVVSPYYLALDQGQIMAAIGNALAQDMLRDAFVTRKFQRTPFSARDQGRKVQRRSLIAGA